MFYEWKHAVGAGVRRAEVTMLTHQSKYLLTHISKEGITSSCVVVVFSGRPRVRL